ncbi:MAG: sigma-54 dependent transcriptional regulator [Deltaproteobacteria bacterium]|nr:sigma-54 dependent transcriptional regulator [Deltaproteobacteria bacterium]
MSDGIGKQDSVADRILIVDDDPHMRSALSLSLKKTGREGDIFASAEEALKFLDGLDGTAAETAEGGGYFLILSDLNLPGMDGISFLSEIKKRGAFKSIPFVIITAYGTVESAVAAMKSGAADYLLKPFDISDFEKMLKNAEKISAYEALKKNAAGADADTDDKSGFICESAAMKKIGEYIKAVAGADATVLITGESGTGKEVAAKRIHNLSKRKGKFIGVNCSAIVSTLLESELFGHEKGAFTGAVSLKKGKFEQADGGTILLDEIAEMAQNLQAKILRVLQEKTIDRVGGDEPVPVNARVIAATNKDIEKAVAEGSFREDLFYRLNVIRLHLPPLRERKEDIIPLAKYFTSAYAKKYFREISGITEEGQNYLLSLSFPGNIRELENIIERAVILAQKDNYLDVRHFGSFARIDENGGAGNESAVNADAANSAGNGDKINSAPISDTVSTFNIKEMEEKLIIAALEETGGNRTKAAEKLGITSRTLRNKLKELKIAAD